nr:PEP/pyruvate-binding domain-containing protein [Kribbella solani]
MIPLHAATTPTCGPKAATLSTLHNAGLPVPNAAIVPTTAFPSPTNTSPTAPVDVGSSADLLSEVLIFGLGAWLESIGDPPVAVRSSATNEDTATTSAAGQYDTFLGVQGLAAVTTAVRACWSSLWSTRATAYRTTDVQALAMAVVIQELVDAEVSGVMFTPADATGSTLIEASWGLGPSVVEGRLTPDSYEITADGSVTATIADKPTALYRTGSHVLEQDVPADLRRTPTLSTETATQLAALGNQVTDLLGGPQDIEWAIANNQLWLLQSRPITTSPPSPTRAPAPHSTTRAAAALPGVASTPDAGSMLTGVPASRGTASGPVRVVRGPQDFADVRPGDILVCRCTDPAWTPLLGIVAGVVTEVGGVLSHAAIVARERGIPAIVSVPAATTRLRNGKQITLDATTGAVHL